MKMEIITFPKILLKRIALLKRRKKFRKISFLSLARIILYLLIFFLPLFFLPFSAIPLQAGKQILAGILVLLAFLCYLIYSLSHYQIIYPKSWLALSVLIFLIITAFSTIFSKASWIAFWGNLTQPDSFFAIFIYSLIFFLSAVLFSEKDLTKIGFCFFGGWLLASVFGIFQVFGKFILPWNFTHQVNFNSIGTPFSWTIFVALGVVLIIALLSSFKFSKKLTTLLGGLGILGMGILVMINFKMIWIILALTMFLLTALKFIREEKIILPLLVFAFSLVFVFISSNLPNWVILPGEVRPNASHTLSIAKEVWKENQFLLGSGPATFVYDYAHFPPLAVIQSPLWLLRFNQGFSFLFTLPSTLGILGTLSFLFLVFCFLYQAFKSKEKEFLVIAAGVVFLLICLAVYPSFFTQMAFLFLGLGLLNFSFKQQMKIDFYPQMIKERVQVLFMFLTISIFLALSLIGVYLLSQKCLAFIYYQKGDFVEAAKLDPHSDLYLRNLSQDLISEIKDTSNFFSIQDKINSALNAARRATQINPLDASNWANLANIYENLIPVENAAEFAIENYRKALEREPKNPQRLVDLARVLIISAKQVQTEEKNKKLNEAKEKLIEATKLKPDYTPAHFLLAQLYFEEGDFQKAKKEIEEVKRLNPQDSQWAFQIGFLYYQNNQIDLAQKEFERAVALSPNYSNARYFLGLIYDKKGEKEKAIEQFERIKLFNPENEKVKRILENLREGKSALEGIE